jgi:hypothetical protein
MALIHRHESVKVIGSVEDSFERETEPLTRLKTYIHMHRIMRGVIVTCT